MHVVRFNVSVEGHMSLEDAVAAFRRNKFISLTHKTSANKIFSFGRDHGHYGRIYNHAVVPIPGLFVANAAGTTLVSGFCYTPQDGNSLLSSAVAAVYGLHSEKYTEYLDVLDQVLFDSV
jgi:glyceraldehyde-3-phosphate dehydrogenase (NAD(P))